MIERNWCSALLRWNLMRRALITKWLFYILLFTAFNYNRGAVSQDCRSHWSDEIIRITIFLCLCKNSAVLVGVCLFMQKTLEPHWSLNSFSLLTERITRRRWLSFYLAISTNWKRGEKNQFFSCVTQNIVQMTLHIFCLLWMHEAAHSDPLVSLWLKQNETALKSVILKAVFRPAMSRTRYQALFYFRFRP